MAMHNDIAVYVNGINRTSNLVVPIKYGNFLDERLDEMTVCLRRVKKSDFPPFSAVEINIRQTEYFGDWKSAEVNKVKTQTVTKRFFVANDDGKEVVPGTDIYNHDLYLLEPTKILERVVTDSLTVTNALGRNYSGETSEYAEPIFE